MLQTTCTEETSRINMTHIWNINLLQVHYDCWYVYFKAESNKLHIMPNYRGYGACTDPKQDIQSNCLTYKNPIILPPTNKVIFL